MSEKDSTVAEKRDPLLGTLFDRRFRVDFRLAAGGYGAIYSAVEIANGREVALKVLHSSLAADRSCLARFRREGSLLTKLRDPHTLAAYELGEAPDGTLDIVMELLKGETVYDRLKKKGAFKWEDTIRIAKQICSSLAEAHGRGVVHRDLKPSNVFLEKRGDADFVKVLDFGIAKILRGPDQPQTQLTRTGHIIGTVEYMSPEQVQGEVCTGRSDIYGVGILMYEMTVGQRPFAEAKDPATLLAVMLHGPPPRPSVGARVPAELERVIMRCLALEPRDRYRDVQSLTAALDRILHDGDPNTATARASDPDEEPTWFDPRVRVNTPKPAPEVEEAAAAGEGRTVFAPAPPPPQVVTSIPPVGTMSFSPPTPPEPPPKPPDPKIRASTTDAANEAWVRTAVWIIVVMTVAILAILIAIKVR